MMTACGIANAADKAMFEQRERMYLQTSGQYSAEELDQIKRLFSFTVLALEENPEQDFLGGLYTALELCDTRNEQFFTPYTVAKTMARLQCGDLAGEIKAKGSIRVSDPCCGAGALLIAFANAAREQGVDYQRGIVFIARDIDFTASMMCFIQLSLLGCAGCVVVGDTLRPGPVPPQNIWYMPLGVYLGTCRRNQIELEESQ